MKNKIFTILILIIIIFSAIVIPKINGNTQVVSIQNTELKAGEKINVFVDLANINFNVSKIVLTTDVYMEPLLDGLSGVFTNKTFTIENTVINVFTDAVYVSYIIPDYVAGGTEINIVASIYDDTDTEQVRSEFIIKVVSEEKNNENNQNNTEITEDSNQKQSSTQNINRSSSSGMYVSSSETVTYKGSRNNYLKSLSVEGYNFNFEFNKTNNTYFITVPNDVTKINVNAIKEDSTAKVSVSGNANLKEGLNKVLVSVLAQNGDIRNYRIYVERSK